MVSKYSIAVIPFINLSEDNDKKYFSDGLSEVIINALSKIEGLYVTSRKSSFVFNNQAIDYREVGERLTVSFLLEGSVRYEESKVRITAKLIDTLNGLLVWTETWDRQLNDLFIFQDEIAWDIARIINKQFIPKSQKAGIVTDNALAIDLYLRGQYLLNQLDSSKSELMLSYFDQAVSLAPTFYQPKIGLCHSYTWLSSIGLINPQVAREKIDKTIEELFGLRLPIPDLYLLLSEKNFWMEWKPLAALKNANIALELRPSSSQGFIDKGLALTTLSKVDEAFDSFFQAERLNPYSENVKYCIGFLYHLEGEDEKALTYLDQSIELAPNWQASYFTKIQALCGLGEFHQACELIGSLSGNPIFSGIIPLLKGIYYAYSDDAENAFEQIKLIEPHLNVSTTIAPFVYYIALLYLKLKQNDQALRYLVKGIEFRATPFLFIHIDSNWDELRHDSHFINALKMVPFIAHTSSADTETRKYKNSALTKEMAETIHSRLQILMSDERLFLNSTLSLAQLSEQININPNQLSQYLNEYEKKNFYEYLNTLRLKHFIEISKNTKYKGFSLLGLAYESGFNSKTTFNTFFKKEMGTSPSEYLKSNQGI